MRRGWHLLFAPFQGRPRFAGLTVAAPLFGALVARAPLAAGGAGAILVVGAVALASPTMFVAMAAFLSAAVPKAGVNHRGIPIPFMVFMLILAVILLGQQSEATAPRRGRRLGLACLAWLAYRLVAMRLNGGSFASLLALIGWYGLPIFLFLIGPTFGHLRRSIGRSWTRNLETGVLVACAFGLVQQVFGIEQTAIPGLTRAVGADYSQKPLAFAGGSKIPSTYQNGNLLGVITALFFLISADRVLRGRGSRRDALILVATSVASVLSGSRTVISGLLLGLAVLVVTSRPSGRVIAVCAAAAMAFVAVLQLSPALSARLTGTTVDDPALAQRTVIWSKVIDSTPVVDFATGGPEWARPTEEQPSLAEGILGAIQQVGVVGMALFVGTFLSATNTASLRRWRVMLIPVAVSLAVDSAYLVFPTLFLPIARMFGAIDTDDGAPAPDATELPADRRDSDLAVV